MIDCFCPSNNSNLSVRSFIFTGISAGALIAVMPLTHNASISVLKGFTMPLIVNCEVIPARSADAGVRFTLNGLVEVCS